MISLKTAPKSATKNAEPDDAVLDGAAAALAAEQAAGRVAVAIAQTKAAKEPVRRVHYTTETQTLGTTTVEDFGGVMIGPAPACGRGGIVSIRVPDLDNEADCTAAADEAAYLAVRYAQSKARLMGRPVDPEFEVEVIAAARRDGGRITERPALLRVLIKTLDAKGRLRGVKTVATRVTQTGRRLAAFVTTLHSRG